MSFLATYGTVGASFSLLHALVFGLSEPSLLQGRPVFALGVPEGDESFMSVVVQELLSSSMSERKGSSSASFPLVPIVAPLPEEPIHLVLDDGCVSFCRL